MMDASIWTSVQILVISFVVLSQSASWFVDGAVGFANALRVPKIVIGIVLVSLATTLPELAVSVTGAIRGHPEIALGNAVGSVICDDGLALPLAAFFAAGVIAIPARTLLTAGLFILIIDFLALGMAWDGTLNRMEGALLLGGFFIYLWLAYRTEKRGATEGHPTEAGFFGEGEAAHVGTSNALKDSPGSLGLRFAGGLVGVILSGNLIVLSAGSLAKGLGMPEEVIALGLVAFGTSVPEVATCIVAARKGEGAIAVGNILGADILNICWVAAASAVVNPLTVQKKTIIFMFPVMIVMVTVMLVLMRIGHRMTRWKGGVLLGIYLLYLAGLVIFFKPDALLH